MTPSNIAAYRLSLAAKQGILSAGPLVPRANGHAGKLAAAIAKLGPRWVLHRSNNVKRLAKPLPENYVWQPRAAKGRK